MDSESGYERGTRAGRRAVRLFEADPDLGQGLPPGQQAWLRRVWVESIRLTPKQQLPTQEGSALGLVVLEGYLVREVVLLGRRGVELVGAGDVLSARVRRARSAMAGRDATTALTVVELAVLDGDFAKLAARIPSLTGRLLMRTADRADQLRRQDAISRVSGLAARLVVLFWHLADRWGKQEEDGRTTLPLPLQHALLADLSGAQRESVSRALRALRELGIVYRHPSGYWTLSGLPPQTPEELILIQGQASATMLRKPREPT